MIMTVTYFVANRNSMYKNFAMVGTSFFGHLISHRNLREIHRQAISTFYLFASGHSSNADAYQGKMAPRAKAGLAPACSNLNFRKQMYCSEERTWDIVGTFRRPPQ